MALIDVIKYEGGNDTFVWKHPREDFNSEAQLIVHESQEAIVFKDGVASNVYGPGKYSIKSDNVPGIRGLISLVTGGDNPNHCEVYFINKAVSMNIHWGTATPMTVQDPVWTVPFQVQAFGQFSVRVGETKKLLLKLVGTMDSFTQTTLTEYFKALLMSRIKECISNQMIQKKRSFMEINSYLSEIEASVEKDIADAFTNYGLVLDSFLVQSIKIIQDETYHKIRDAIATQIGRTVEGITKQEELAYDVAKTQAANQGMSGNIANIGTGYAAAMTMGPVIGGMMGGALQPTMSGMNAVPGNAKKGPNLDFVTVKPQAVENVCRNCGKTIATPGNFCPHCGNPTGPNATVKCSNCGAEVIPGANFCAGCGTKV